MLASGLGHPEEAIPDMRRPDARSRNIRSPEGVLFRLQVSSYSIEPAVSSRSTNLFPKDAHRLTLAEEGIENGPKVPFVGFFLLLASFTEWLAGARGCPNRSSCWPAGKSEGKGPATDSGEPMALRARFDFGTLHLPNVPPVDGISLDLTSLDEVSQPVRCVAVQLVEVDHDARLSGKRGKPSLASLAYRSIRSSRPGSIPGGGIFAIAKSMPMGKPRSISSWQSRQIRRPTCRAFRHR